MTKPPACSSIRAKLHALNHNGEFFQVKGPLNIARSAQGQPVIFQAGASEDGKNFAAARADAIFVHHENLEEGKAYYRDTKNRAAGFGRDPNDLFILPGIRPVIGSTEEEAERKYQEFANLTSIENALSMLGRPFNDYDFLQHDLDDPFPDVEAHGANSNQSTSNRILDTARRENLTLRQVALRFATPRTEFVGTPSQVADALQRWLEERGSDGFVINVSLPKELDVFVETVVPILQERGIYRTEYEAETFRGNLGIPVPVNRYAGRDCGRSRVNFPSGYLTLTKVEPHYDNSLTPFYQFCHRRPRLRVDARNSVLNIRSSGSEQGHTSHWRPDRGDARKAGGRGFVERRALSD